VKPTAGALLLLAPLLAAQAWLWPLGVRAAGSGRLFLPERHEWSEGANSRSRVRYEWIPLAKPDAVRLGWGIQAAAALMAVWSIAALLYGRPGWTKIRRPLAAVSALFAAATLLLLLPPWRARDFPLAGGCWTVVMLAGAVEIAGRPVGRRLGPARMQALNRTVGAAVLFVAAMFFGWNAFFGGMIGVVVLGLGGFHAQVFRTAHDAPGRGRAVA